MSSLDHAIRMLAPDGIRIHLWPTKDGRYQANVAEPGSDGWTCHTTDDPIEALAVVLRQRVARVPDRKVEYFDDETGEVPSPAAAPQQIDIEEAIAAVSSDDDFDGLL